MLLAACFGACTGDPGNEGTDILVPFDQLGNGIIFATSRIPGSAGYDLYRIPFPDLRITSAQLPVLLTGASGDEWQPAVARNGGGIVFVKDFEIHAITSSGRIRKISETSGTDFKDSLPAISADALYVAWVREDFSRKIGDSGFVETYIMLANFDGTNQRALQPQDGVIQDAPVFDPAIDATRVAWSEFAISSLSSTDGPLDYGVRIFDFTSNMGSFACKSENGLTPGTSALQPRGGAGSYRCFGQHLAWPRDDVLVLPQNFLEMYLRQGQIGSIWNEAVTAVQRQVNLNPEIGARQDGFHAAFPLSVSYTPDAATMVFDGVIGPTPEGDLRTLAFFIGDSSGSSPRRVEVLGLKNDLDTVNTANFLFSLATPQLVPFRTP